jgi:site-specific recombinase XerD
MIVTATFADDEVAAFERVLSARDQKTRLAYRAVLRDFRAWLATRPGGSPFRPELLTEAAVKGYMDHLASIGRAPRTRSKALSALRRFCRWAQDEGLLRRNPAAYVERPTVVQLAPRELSEDQRYVLKTLVERQGSKRLSAIFALGYWTGLRVSEVATLRLEHCDLESLDGSVTIVVTNTSSARTRQRKARTLVLHDEARRALRTYLHENKGADDARDSESAYVFTGHLAARQRLHGRPDHLTPHAIDGIWKRAKQAATIDEWEIVRDVRLYDLRHDFVQRARAYGWSLEEIAAYLGQQARDGTPTLPAPLQHDPLDRGHLEERLRNLRGRFESSWPRL